MSRAQGESQRPLSIAMIGTRGIPARYGGFETAVEEIGRRLVDRGHRVRVYCRAGNADEYGAHYLGMERVVLPAMRRRSMETLSHSAASMAHLVRHRTDVAFVFNSANSPLLPMLRVARVPVAINVDGLEWKRAKWSGAGRRYYRFAETIAVQQADALIADSVGIRDYYREQYAVSTELIAYGAPISENLPTDKIHEMGLSSRGYHVLVARFEPENHVDTIVEGYVASAATKPLVVVGSAPYAAEYTTRIHALANGDPRVHFVGSVWDQDLLDALYGHALTYLHGQSVGGTNPSLLRAIGAGTATIATDVRFNREVLLENGRYFTTAAGVSEHLEAAERDPEATLQRGALLQRRAADYDWDDVARGYENLAYTLNDRTADGPRPFARRRRHPGGK